MQSPKGKKPVPPKKKASRFGMVVGDALTAMGQNQQAFAERAEVSGPGLNRIINGHARAGLDWMQKIVAGLAEEHQPRAVAAWLVDSIDELPPEVRALVNIVPGSSGSPCLKEDAPLPERPQLDKRRMEVLLWVERQILHPTFLEMLEIQKRLMGG